MASLAFILLAHVCEQVAEGCQLKVERTRELNLQLESCTVMGTARLPQGWDHLHGNTAGTGMSYGNTADDIATNCSFKTSKLVITTTGMFILQPMPVPLFTYLISLNSHA